MSGLMETQFKENDFDSRYMKYGTKLAEENKNKAHRNVKDIETDFKKANNKEQNWQAKISEQKNNQEKTR